MTTQRHSEYVAATTIDSIYGFVKGAALQPGSNPGFGHATKLSYNLIDKQRFSITGPKSLCYRYKLSPDVSKYTTGLLTALMDELSPYPCFRVGQPSAPGLSLQMQTELVPSKQTGLALESLEELEIDSVVTKLGRKIAFVRTDFRDTKTNQLVAFSSHVKYMPTGSFVVDWIMNNRFLYDLYEKFYLQSAQVPFHEEKPIVQGVLRPHLQFINAGQATFEVTQEHTNPFGSLHGGCHAMVMEMVAEAFAKDTLGCDKVILEAIQIEFLAAGKLGKTLDVFCESLGADETVKACDILQVRVLIQGGGRVCSDGQLRFARA